MRLSVNGLAWLLCLLSCVSRGLSLDTALALSALLAYISGMGCTVQPSHKGSNMSTIIRYFQLRTMHPDYTPSLCWRLAMVDTGRCI